MSEESESSENQLDGAKPRAAEAEAEATPAAGESESILEERSEGSTAATKGQSDEAESESRIEEETTATQGELKKGEEQSTTSQKEGDTSSSSATQQDFADYAQHVSYAADGGAIYTDPSTKQKYKWCNTLNNWKPLSDDEAATAGNLYENEHYKWCQETQQWLPKEQNASQTETEHYKWDAEQQKWLPKQQKAATEAESDGKTPKAPGQDVVYGVDENGDRTYTDKDGAVFFWDVSKSAWFPKIDDDFMARYQMNYGFIDNTSAGEREKEEREAAEAKRKEEELKRMTAEAQAAMNTPVDGEACTATTATSGATAGGKRKAQDPPSKLSRLTL